MDQKGLSIVVPIYNSEKYLVQCLDSIVAQSYSDLEVLLIDDGSTDSSSEICDRYAENYPNIQVFHFKNEGLVKARKRGVRLATKEYITFVDSDDWIDPNMYQDMMKLFIQTNSDIVISGIIQEYENGTNTINLGTLRSGIYDEQQIASNLPLMIYDAKAKFPGLCPAVWNKIFKTKCLAELYEIIDDRLTLGEDAIISYPLICKSSQIYIMDKAYYHYRLHEQSMCHKYDVRSFEKIMWLENNMKNVFERMNLLTKYEHIIEQYIFIFLCHAINEVYHINAAVDSVKYVFPYEHFERGCKLVLYGFGSVGRSYYTYLRKSDYLDLVGIVDKNYDKYVGYGTDIYSTEKLCILKFDFVLIALEDEGIASKVKDELIRIGVEPPKIVWFKPIRI